MYDNTAENLSVTRFELPPPGKLLSISQIAVHSKVCGAPEHETSLKRYLDPLVYAMEILGAVSASADLLKLSIKASKAAKGLVQSFLAAPTELVELATELERLQGKFEQMQGLCNGITTAPTSPSSSEAFPTADTLLPPNHRQALYMALQKSLEALQKIQRLCNREHVEGIHGNTGKMPASLQDVRHRIQWATINKRKASYILEDVKLAQGGVVDVLHILSMYVINPDWRFFFLST